MRWWQFSLFFSNFQHISRWFSLEPSLYVWCVCLQRRLEPSLYVRFSISNSRALTSTLSFPHSHFTLIFYFHSLITAALSLSLFPSPTTAPPHPQPSSLCRPLHSPPSQISPPSNTLSHQLLLREPAELRHCVGSHREQASSSRAPPRFASRRRAPLCPSPLRRPSSCAILHIRWPSSHHHQRNPRICLVSGHTYFQFTIFHSHFHLSFAIFLKLYWLGSLVLYNMLYLLSFEACCSGPYNWKSQFLLSTYKTESTYLIFLLFYGNSVTGIVFSTILVASNRCRPGFSSTQHQDL